MERLQLMLTLSQMKASSLAMKKVRLGAQSLALSPLVMKSAELIHVLYIFKFTKMYIACSVMKMRKLMNSYGLMHWGTLERPSWD